MKKVASKKMLLFFMCLFLAIGHGSLLWAQPMEEEEEELQARPNPMDKTNMKGRGILSMTPGQSLQNKGITGKGLTVGGTGIASPGSSAASGSGSLPGPNPIQPMKTGKGLTEGGAGIAMPGSSAASSSGSLPTPNPIQPMKTGKGLTVGGTGIASPGSAAASGSGSLPTPNPINPVNLPAVQENKAQQNNMQWKDNTSIPR